jgi:hypothetical protein
MPMDRFPWRRQRFDGSTELRRTSELKRSTELTPKSKVLPASERFVMQMQNWDKPKPETCLRS